MRLTRTWCTTDNCQKFLWFWVSKFASRPVFCFVQDGRTLTIEQLQINSQSLHPEDSQLINDMIASRKLLEFELINETMFVNFMQDHLSEAVQHSGGLYVLATPPRRSPRHLQPNPRGSSREIELENCRFTLLKLFTIYNEFFLLKTWVGTVLVFAFNKPKFVLYQSKNKWIWA